jgi:outer membrane lipoprotein LolB
MRLRWFSLALPFLLLAACATPPVRVSGDAGLMAAQAAREKALVGRDRWTIEGKLGVTDGKTGGSGSLTWRQDGENYEFTMRAPVSGKTLFRLSGSPGHALLEGLEQGPLSGTDAEALMSRAVGWEVPLHDLRAWVVGARADSGPAELSFGANRLPSLLTQDGWSVEYREWDTGRHPELPTKVFAARLPYHVKLSIESWTFD